MDETINGFPAFLYNKLAEHYPEQVQAICCGSTARPVSLRVNRLKGDASGLYAALCQAGFTVLRIPYDEDAFLLPDADFSAIKSLESYQQGHFYLQSLSSMLPVLLLRPRPGEDILDMAAAPGGKTTQIVSLTGGKAPVTACERHPIRAQRLRYNLDRQGAGQVQVLVKDARELENWFSFDKVLLDAPCTGSGTLDRHRDNSHVTPALLKRVTATQKALLNKADQVLKPGGLLVYSTCSVLPEENQRQVEPFLRGGRYTAEPLPDGLAEHLPLLPAEDPMLCLCPTDRYEGFFAVALRKIR